jgi:hypothetical protein
MFYIDLWRFTIITFIWFITLQNGKISFCIFSLSVTYTKSNWPAVFGASFFIGRSTLALGTTPGEA